MLSWIPHNLTSTTQVHHCHARVLLCLSNHHCSPRLPPAQSPPLPSSPTERGQHRYNQTHTYCIIWQICKLQIPDFIHDRSIAQTKSIRELFKHQHQKKRPAVDFYDIKNITCQVSSRKLNKRYLVSNKSLLLKHEQAELNRRRKE